MSGSSSGGSLLRTLGHRAIARKCEQIVSVPDAFQPTRAHDTIQRSSLERELSPDSAGVPATSAAGVPGTGPSLMPLEALPVRRISSGDSTDSLMSWQPDSPSSSDEKENVTDTEVWENPSGRENPMATLFPSTRLSVPAGERSALSTLWDPTHERAEESSSDDEGTDSGSDTDQEAFDSMDVTPYSPSAREQGMMTKDDEAALADRILAQYYIMERPELQRFDSADAALQAWHQKGEQGGGSSGSSWSTAAGDGCEPRLGLALDTPPPSIYAGDCCRTDSENSTPVCTPYLRDHHARMTEGFTEISLNSPSPSPLPSLLPRETEVERQSNEEERLDDAPVLECQYHLEGQPLSRLPVAFVPKPPSLKHFDSADYQLDREQHKQDNTAVPHHQHSSLAETAMQVQGRQQDGHKTVANYMIHRGETRTQCL